MMVPLWPAMLPATVSSLFSVLRPLPASSFPSHRLVCQTGDVVTLRWEGTLVASGVAVDARKTHYSLLTERGEQVVEVQVGRGECCLRGSPTAGRHQHRLSA